MFRFLRRLRSSGEHSSALQIGALLAAGSSSGLTCLLAVLGSGWLAIPAGAALVFVLAALLGVFRARHRSSSSPSLEKLSSDAMEGRKLVFYERETGLYAYWYLVLRGDEECQRAQRYDSPLALLIVEQDSNENPEGALGDFTQWLEGNLRSVDLTAYLGNGRFVVLMPNTDLQGTQTALKRLSGDVQNVVMAASLSPHDGDNFEALYAAARARLIDASEAAA